MAIQLSAANMHLQSSLGFGLAATGQPYTFSVWLNCNWAPGSRCGFVGIYGAATDSPLQVPTTAMQIGTLGSGELAIWTAGYGALFITATAVMTSYSNTWVHVVMQYSGTAYTCYVNSAAVSAATSGSATTGYLNQIWINGTPGGTGITDTSSFQLDALTVYRSILTNDEVGNIYRARGSRHGKIVGLIARYEFAVGTEGSTVTTVPDLTNGTGTNAGALTATGASSPTYAYTTDPAGGGVATSNLRPVLG